MAVEEVGGQHTWRACKVHQPGMRPKLLQLSGGEERRSLRLIHCPEGGIAAKPLHIPGQGQLCPLASSAQQVEHVLVVEAQSRSVVLQNVLRSGRGRTELVDVKH